MRTAAPFWPTRASKEMGMPLADAASVAAAIGNHDEKTGTAFDVVSAALILADKTRCAP